MLENKKVKGRPCILKKLLSQNNLRKESNHVMNVTSCAFLKIVNNHKINKIIFLVFFFTNHITNQYNFHNNLIKLT